MEFCPKCEREILPYMKTNELKRIKDGKLVKYQLYYCVVCNDVYYLEHETHRFIDLKTTKIAMKGVRNALTSKKQKQISSRDST